MTTPYDDLEDDAAVSPATATGVYPRADREQFFTDIQKAQLRENIGIAAGDLLDIASEAEAAAGAITDKAISPAGGTFLVNARIASAEVAEAGIDTSALLSVQRGTQLLNARLASSGDLAGLSETKILSVLRAKELIDSRAGFAVRNLADLQARTIPVAITRVRLSDYTTGALGGCNMRRVGSEPSHAGKAQDASGAWFEIDESHILPEMLGCVGDADFAAVTGTMNTTPLTNTVAVAAAQGRPILLLGRYRTAASALVLASKVQIVGVGFTSGFLIEMGADDFGIHDKAGCHLENFRTHVHATTASSGGTQFGILLGNFYIEPQDDPEIRGFYHSRLRITRTADGATGWYGLGNICDGYVGDIDDIGSPGYHSALMRLHWSGRGTAYGSTITKTWHPRDIEIGSLRAEKSRELFVPSSSFNIIQRGVSYIKGGRGLIYSLPGDEADRFSQHSAGAVGKNLRFLGPWFGLDMEDESTSQCIEIFTIGTSPFEKTASDPTVPLPTELAMDIEIGDVTIINSPNADKRVLKAFIVSKASRVKIGHLTGVNCPDTIRAFDINRCNGQIEIAGLWGTFKRHSLRITRSFNVRVLSGEIGSTETDEFASENTTFYTAGELTGPFVVDGAHTIGATSIAFTAPLTERILPGMNLIIGSDVIEVTSYAPNSATFGGVSEVQVKPLINALSGGEDMYIDYQNKNVEVNATIKGGRLGIDMTGASLVFGGTIMEAAVSGARVRGGGILNLKAGTRFFRNGQLKRTSAVGTADLVIANEACLVTSHGCIYGEDGQFVDYNIRGATAEGDHIRYVGIGDKFIENVSGPVLFDSRKNYQLIGCVDADGDNLNNGTWTPALLINSSATGITTSSAVGWFKIENRTIELYFKIVLTSKGASTGSVTVSGIPVTVGDYDAVGRATILSGSSLTSPFCRVAAAGSVISIVQTSATGFGAVTNSNISDTSTIEGQITYQF